MSASTASGGAAARSRRDYSYAVERDGAVWRIGYGPCRAGRFATKADAVAAADKLAREACAVGGAGRLVIVHERGVEVRLFRRDTLRGTDGASET